MRFPQMIGDDQPQPGKSVFQTTFSVVLQDSGSVVPSPRPSTCAPRNCGQFLVWAETTETRNNPRNAEKVVAFMFDRFNRAGRLALAGHTSIIKANDDNREPRI